MSVYFTLADLQARMGSVVVAQIFDDDSTGDADAVPITAIIADASSKVDSYLQGGYLLPLVGSANEAQPLATIIKAQLVALAALPAASDAGIVAAISAMNATLAPYIAAPAIAPPNEVKRLALDVAVALAYQRHPEIGRGNWVDLMKTAEAELEKLRDGKTRLDSPEGINAPKNEGGQFAGDPRGGLLEDPRSPFFTDGLGDF